MLSLTVRRNRPRNVSVWVCNSKVETTYGRINDLEIPYSMLILRLGKFLRMTIISEQVHVARTQRTAAVVNIVYSESLKE